MKHINNKKNITIISLLFISLFIMFISFSFYIKINDFSSKSVIEHINYFANDSLQGRLPGTLGNKMAEEYIISNFNETKLLSYDNDYRNSFSISYPKKLDFQPKLDIIDSKSNNTITSFKYGTDYKDDGTNYRVNDISFNKENIYNQTDSHLIIKNNSDYVLFYVPKDDNLSFRSSFFCSSDFSLTLALTKDTLNNLVASLKDGYLANVKIPFKNEKTDVNNVIGYIEGKDSTADPIVISCHFDHVGSDAIGTVYYGALDNASGSAFVLELIDYISSLGKPSRDIVFAFFNAEEFGCLGSNNFLTTHKDSLTDSKVYNFDMIGSYNGIPLCVLGGSKDTKDTDLICELSQILESKKEYFNYLFDDSSDHMFFRKNNIEAVTLIDNDLSRIHTPNDTVEFIDEKAINRAFGVISSELCLNYFDNPFIKYNKLLLSTSLTTSIIFISLLLFKHIKINKKSSS